MTPLFLAAGGLYALIALLAYVSMLQIAANNPFDFGFSRQGDLHRSRFIFAGLALLWPITFLWKAIYCFLED